jgi:hypothetical protein
MSGESSGFAIRVGTDVTSVANLWVPIISSWPVQLDFCGSTRQAVVDCP